MSSFIHYTIFLYSCLSITLVKGEYEPWSFIVSSDWHNAENFALRPYHPSTPLVQQKISVIQYIKQHHSGDLILIPGDVNVGHWDSPTFVNRFQKMYGENLTIPEIIQLAASHCYTGTLQTFSMGGYDTILMAVGDHELGDNPWLASSSDTDMMPYFRQGFQRVFNRNSSTGIFTYSEPIGTIPSRPIGTQFENTSYAYRHKNALFVTVDVFDFISTPPTTNYLNRSTGDGGEGVLVGTVQGDHLIWFESILKESKNDPTIRHILVQGHLPILQPVRKINSSAMSMMMAQESEFFQLMRKYHVDVYFAGEVHTNTVIQDSESHVLQVVSRGNGFNNYLHVQVTDTRLDMTLYNEIGTKPKYNQQYEWFGSLTLDKSRGYVAVESHGQLEILDRDAPLIYFDFEEVIPLGARVVLGLSHDHADKTLVQSQMTIRNVVCRDALINHGCYGQQYDAQVSLQLDEAGSSHALGKSGHFTPDSRMAIWGMGPGSGGHVVSWACWFKTSFQYKMVLIHYGETFANKNGMALHEPEKDIFTLVLHDGIPCLYRNIQSKLCPIGKVDRTIDNMADGRWHHIAISMPRKSCLFSQVQMYLDGVEIATRLDGMDDNIFLTSSGKWSIGGYGSSGSAYDTDFDFNPFAGWIDEVYVWGRSLNQYDMTLIFTTVLNSNLSLGRAKGYDQVSQDIHLTVFILLVGSLSFAACIWYQRARYFRNDGELHNN